VAATGTSVGPPAGVADVFVLRRVGGQRFVHLAGSGRGAGWAGIVEVSLDDEASLAEALASGRPVRLEHGGRDLVFGPYYARAATVVPVPPDVVVVYGASEDGTAMVLADDELLAVAASTADGLEPPGDAKRLADELELLEAIRTAAAVPPASVFEAMAALANVAAEALSCELGMLYLRDGHRLAVAERGWSQPADIDDVAAAFAGVLSGRRFPVCVQDARSAPPPGVLAADAGIRSYYLLRLTGVAEGVLFVAHTDAAPRGFTLLCRRLGVRVAEVASTVLGLAVTREWIGAESARLQTAFADLES
jgi:hypothetical protein